MWAEGMLVWRRNVVVELSALVLFALSGAGAVAQCHLIGFDFMGGIG